MGCSKVRAWSIAALAAAMSLTACSSEEPAAQPPQPTNSAESSGVQVPNPKDATAVKPCDMLSDQAATELGIEPEGRSAREGAGCRWDAKDLSLTLTLTSPPGRSIQEFYNSKSAFVDYEELTIAGYPAVRANDGNPSQDGFCDFFLATNTNQLIQASGRDSSHTDPCGLAQKALEATVQNLPAAN